jgi:type II restriction enzyme
MIFADCQKSVYEIINRLTVDPKSNKISELNILKNSLSGNINILKPAKVDIFVETPDGEQYSFDLKTAKPNKGDYQKFK